MLRTIALGWRIVGQLQQLLVNTAGACCRLRAKRQLGGPKNHEESQAEVHFALCDLWQIKFQGRTNAINSREKREVQLNMRISQLCTAQRYLHSGRAQVLRLAVTS